MKWREKAWKVWRSGYVTLKGNRESFDAGIDAVIAEAQAMAEELDKEDTHKWPDDLLLPLITTRIEQARAEEREACALAISGAAHELCEHSADPCDAYVEGAEVAIAAIRARAKETL